MTSPEKTQYTVVARRYRPQSFADLVGQGHISQALSNAIRQNRVGHAYLFTGARGVGKTSSARIFAKCLNCKQGPTVVPCNACDICHTVSIGEDVDVLEIDGASNRGIDEIRQLRSNANVRPSRSRYKIYIIDEVHMLTSPAFNALLKTLEEPPEHVKFIFCTTDPQKIPITVLSRCQRFDFSPVQTNEIAQRLREICENEQIEADEAALALLARRAGGSMRDSQSLLEQLLSFCDQRLTVEDVNQLLGTADMGRISEFASAMTSAQSGECLAQIAAAIESGVDAGQLTEQTLGYFRDMMAMHVGGTSDILLNCGESDVSELKKQSEHLGLETILSIIQILDQTVVRMQSSLHTRTLLEVAAVRICNLENLDLLADLASQLGQSKTSPASRAPTVKKNEITELKPHRPTSPSPASTSPTSPSPTSTSPTSSSPTSPASPGIRTEPTSIPSPPPSKRVESTVAMLETEKPHAEHQSVNPQTTPIHRGNVEQVWRMTIESCGDMTSDMASQYRKLELAHPDKLVVTLSDKYTSDMCSRPERKQKLESALQQTTGQNIRIDFTANIETNHTKQKPRLTRVQQIRQLEEKPLIQSAIELFDAEIVDFHKPKRKD